MIRKVSVSSSLDLVFVLMKEQMESIVLGLVAAHLKGGRCQMLPLFGATNLFFPKTDNARLITSVWTSVTAHNI